MPNGTKGMITSEQDQPTKALTCERELKDSLSSDRNHQQPKAGADATEREPSSSPSKQLPLAASAFFWPHGFSFRVKDIRKGLWNVPPQLRETTEVRPVSGMCPCMEAQRGHYMKL